MVLRIRIRIRIIHSEFRIQYNTVTSFSYSLNFEDELINIIPTQHENDRKTFVLASCYVVLLGILCCCYASRELCGAAHDVGPK